jgi:hypothetical protein
LNQNPIPCFGFGFALAIETVFGFNREEKLAQRSCLSATKHSAGELDFNF